MQKLLIRNLLEYARICYGNVNENKWSKIKIKTGNTLINIMLDLYKNR